MRTETDFRGSLSIPKNALYGIHALRATQHFPLPSPFPLAWYQAIGLVKLAYYNSYQQFRQAVLSKYTDESPIPLIDPQKLDALAQAATEVSQGEHFSHCIVPALQGGAGTSINLNINEIITNRALQIMGHQPGQYQYLHPIDHANIYQSTNDVVPSALKLAAMRNLETLQASINTLRSSIEQLEQQHRNTLRIGYTQMQAAVPTTFGKLFATYCDALSRDWWRVSKCSERIKNINLGGSAIGTGITVPRFMIMNVSKTLQDLCNLPITRSENLSDATANLDSIVEVHGIIKSLAVNLEKIANDVRLLAADILQSPELTLPALQVGSSIMPGKVNPIICEYVISISHKVYANDSIITNLSALGCLELNAYTPSIGVQLLESLQMLTAACSTLTDNLFSQLIVNQSTAEDKLLHNTALATALVPYIGYKNASLIANYMKAQHCNIHQANANLQLIDPVQLQSILQAQSLTKEGFTL